MKQNIENDLQGKIEEALNSIRPFLKNDGGDIELVEVKDNVAYVRLLGNCCGCHISESTMKLGVENIIKQFVPSIERVVNLSE